MTHDPRASVQSHRRVLRILNIGQMARAKWQHPFADLPAGKGRLIFLPFFALTASLMLTASIINRVSGGDPLRTDAAPRGIISFELAGSVGKARKVLDSWDETQRLYAAFALGVDYLFLVAYSTTIGFANVWAAGVLRAGRWPLASVGLVLAWGQWVAALLDAVENAALAIILFRRVAVPWPQIARGAAVLKFALILGGLAYTVWGAVAWIANLVGRTHAAISQAEDQGS